MYNDRNKYNANFYENDKSNNNNEKSKINDPKSQKKKYQLNQDVEFSNENTNEWIEKNYDFNYNDALHYYQSTNNNLK